MTELIETQVRDKTRPQRVTTCTARNRRTSALEHYRCRDAKVNKEDVLARFGMHLGTTLGWKPGEIQITSCRTELEDNVTQSTRNRLIRPRA